LEKVCHAYNHIEDVEDSVHEIILILKQIVLKSCNNDFLFYFLHLFCRWSYAYIRHIKLPSSLQIINKIQCIVTITKSIDFSIDLVIKRDRGFCVNDTHFIDLRREKFER
jgi:DNA-directed RNA polymerase subunit alpha